MSGENSQNKLTEYYQLRKGDKLKFSKDIPSKLVDIDNSNTLKSKSETEINNLDQFGDINNIEEPEDVCSNEINSQSSIDFVESDSSLTLTQSSCSENFKMDKADLNIFEALKFIPEFDGTPSELHRFLECCSIIYDEIKVTEHAKFIRLMKKILTGKA